MTNEDRHQIALFEWAHLQRKAVPELALLAHVPNGGYRDEIEGAKFKRAGVRSGFPDLVLPVPRGGYGALYIELKKPEVKSIGQKAGRLSKNQKAWLAKLNEVGNKAVVAYGFEDAKDKIMEYLNG